MNDERDEGLLTCWEPGCGAAVRELTQIFWAGITEDGWTHGTCVEATCEEEHERTMPSPTAGRGRRVLDDDVLLEALHVDARRDALMTRLREPAA